MNIEFAKSEKTKTHIKFYETEANDEKIYFYSKFDSIGNWTERTVTQTQSDNKSMSSLKVESQTEIRKIYYWK